MMETRYNCNFYMERFMGSHNYGEIVADWRKLLNAELLILYLPPNIIRIIKSRRMR
jgi:hypothetical protein